MREVSVPRIIAMLNSPRKASRHIRWPEGLLNKIICADSLDLMKNIPDQSIDIVLTDPPYFYDKMDEDWEPSQISSRKYQQTVRSLPAGMKFDPEQGKHFYKWYLGVSKELLRVLKPGGFFFSFSAPRLYHRMASAVDDAGFQVRDCFIWLYTRNQVKAMTLDHFIDKMDLSQKSKTALKDKFKGWKTPQVKSCFEPIIFAQKKSNKTFLNNMIEHQVGLINSEAKIGSNMFPANILTIEPVEELIDKYFLVGKPSTAEKGDYNEHRTVKPVALCEHLLKLTAYAENSIVLDPFVGSGTTALAARRLRLKYIGIDSNLEYVKIARKRLTELTRIK